VEAGLEVALGVERIAYLIPAQIVLKPLQPQPATAGITARVINKPSR
jgi:hypothetical protein